jgi:TolB protein
MITTNFPAAALLALALGVGGHPTAVAGESSLSQRLGSAAGKIAYETYQDGNWEIFLVNPDGSNAVNLTRTPKEHEHYPQVSPDGKWICFSVDRGEGREAVRDLCVMEINGQGRRKLAENAREPFWSPDGRTIAFLPQEFSKFNVIDFYTKGMSFCDVATGKIEPHVNSAALHHLYNPSWSPNGKWIAATVHAGMGYDHAILLIEARGGKIIDLKIPGCRPCLSPDGTQIAWGAGDHEIAVAPLDLDADEPRVGEWRLRIKAEKDEIYHVDWSPDNRYLVFSRGLASKGDPNKPGTFMSACEIVGVYAAGWNLCAVPADRRGILDLDRAGEADFHTLTTNGSSNKEPEWFAFGGK